MGRALQAWITEEAKRLANEFMATRTGKKSNSKNAGGDHWSDLAVRIMAGENTLSIIWTRRWWLKQASGKQRFLSRHIPKGKGPSYGKLDLKHWAKEWEWEEVWSLEERFIILRELWGVARSLHKLERAHRKKERQDSDRRAGFNPDPDTSSPGAATETKTG